MTMNRISFNIAFKNSGINEEWSEERYGKLLETGGGKERMTAHWVSDLYPCIICTQDMHIHNK